MTAFTLSKRSRMPGATGRSQFYGQSSTFEQAKFFQVGQAADVTNVDVGVIPGAIVGGRATLASGAPAVGGQVWIHWTGNQTPALSQGVAETDASGGLEHPGRRSGTYTVQYMGSEDSDASGAAWAGDYYPEAATMAGASAIDVSAGDAQTNLDSTLAAPSTIAGKLTDREGHPLTGTAVAYSSGSDDTESSFAGEATVADDGTYVISNLAPGSYSVGFTTVVKKQTAVAEFVRPSKKNAASKPATSSDPEAAPTASRARAATADSSGTGNQYAGDPPRRVVRSRRPTRTSRSGTPSNPPTLRRRLSASPPARRASRAWTRR